MRRRRRIWRQKSSSNQLKISEMVKYEKLICFYYGKNLNNSLMAVKINLKLEILSKFYYIFEISLKYSVILYARIHFFFKCVGKFCERRRQAEISEDYRQGEVSDGFLQMNSNLDILYFKIHIFSGFILKIRGKVLGRTSVFENLRRTSEGRNFNLAKDQYQNC